MVLGVASETSSSALKKPASEESFTKNEGKDIYDYIGARIAKLTCAII